MAQRLLYFQERLVVFDLLDGGFMDIATVLGVFSAFGLVSLAIFMRGGLRLFINLAVLDYFIKDRGLPPSRFTVGGYGPPFTFQSHF